MPSIEKKMTILNGLRTLTPPGFKDWSEEKRDAWFSDHPMGVSERFEGHLTAEQAEHLAREFNLVGAVSVSHYTVKNGMPSVEEFTIEI